MEFKTELIGGSTPEQIKLELTFKELTGKKYSCHANAKYIYIFYCKTAI